LIRGWLYEPAKASGKGLVITHGAGSNCESPLLRDVADAFADAGFHVLRCDLPYRQLRASGPPFPGVAARDREGLQQAAEAMREITADYVMLGGHSYGGRQTTLLAAETPAVANALLLLSYPLHPPRRPEQLRTQHFPQLRTPALFIHGTRDPFGTIEEMTAALAAIPARHHLAAIEKAGHELGAAAPAVILREAECFANA
jgi:predicted alpha/beta-hydrolase family hydrolase